VSGTVVDATGAVVPNAQVKLTEVATKVTRNTITNSAGLYRFDAVDLGECQLEVSAPGFQTMTVTGIEVRANQTSSQDFTMKVGTSSEKVEVTAAASAVALQTDDQVRGANIDAQRIMQLPISGQNSLNLMLSVPGIVPTRTGNGGGVGAVNGSRARANKFLIDGADNNDVSVAGQVITMTNNDAIQEVAIQTGNFSAEFGRTGGAVVNQITKSGTNNLHGTAAWVYRSQIFNASSRSQRIAYFGNLAKAAADPTFVMPPLKPSFKEHIPAFTVGGPMYIPGLYDGRDKTFWFVAGQWDHYNSGGILTNFTVPTAAGVATLQGLASKCPNAALYLKALGGLTASNQTGTVDISVPQSVFAASNTCNGDRRAGISIPFGTGARVTPNNQPLYNLQFRVDHAISSRQNLMVRVYEDYSTQPQYYVGMSRPFDADATFREINAAIAHSFVVTSTLTNELRLNYTRTAYVWTVVDSTGLGSLPTFSFGSGSGILSGFGTSANYPQGRTPNTYQLQDVLTKVAGRHQVRFGWELFRQITRQSAPINARGAVAYATSGAAKTGDLVTYFANFLDDWSGPGNARVSRQYGTPRYHPSYIGTAGFIQDNWKITPELTLNLGVRYDFFGQPANIFPYPEVNFDPAGFSTARIKSDKNNFGPSVGFAWNPKRGFLMGEGKTVVRGGFQISYDTSFNNLLSNMAAGSPNNPSNVPVNSTDTKPTTACPLCGLRGVPTLYATLFPAMTNGGVSTSMDTSSQFTPNMASPYTERWSLGIQRELPQGMLMDLSYVGSASHKLNQQQQLNPNGVPVFDATKGTYSLGSRLVPTIGGRVVRANAANSNYNAMQLEVKKRYSKTPVGGILFSSAYTWSKTLGVIDDVFSTTAGSGVYMSANPLRAPYNGWRTADYGPSDNDRRHNWVSTVVWDLPSPKMRVLSQILGGWQVSGVIPVRSGTPFSVYNGSSGGDRDLDGTNNQDRPDIGNPHAPINTMAQPVGTSTCSTGWQSVMGACVTPNDVRWLYYPAGNYAPATARTAHRNSMVSKGGFISADASIIKTFRIREGKSLEYRAEIFNVANTFNYDFTPQNTTIQGIFDSVKNGVPTATFLDFSQTSPTGYYRNMRMQLKFIF
jgi:outer membrane receptor protein involved in Fe transport